MTTPTIDVHAHVLLPEVEALVADHPGLVEARALDARRNGPAALAVNGPMVRERIPKLTDVTVRLAAMDAQGVDVQLVSPSPSHYHYWADEDTAEEVYRLAGEATAAHCAQAPDRLHGLGLAPLQHPEQAVRALEHALEQGLLGVEISSHAPGRELSDPAYEPFWARAAATGAILFLHPFGCTLDERLDRWYLSNTVGQPTENAVALSHLIFSGVLDRHPDLKLIAAHGGGYLPTHIGRADHAWTARSDAGADCAHLPSSYLKRLYFDSLVHDRYVLGELVRAAGADRVLLGSDFPFDMGTEDPVGALRAARLSDADFHAVRGGNAAALLRLT
ncbi:amidohydrolase family protein [Streptomyces europaeiscabiei]|uniref:Amidohydrolase family protein n=1 Tax=Streptomyces europaeiscabiei TaxID=146819 RepID=A0ABU4NK56_9ACTN|nr:amidohydrolase family protein [Streptomyces europaeiscabiei]MDX3545572.1 amidohydrolase family protein [Streptomyces europaeiscabiei]MDX3555031.1 amidohydrolase family protein [Streptomyces europaeiscabiei]MDX3670775.1 amidohydrolase family protein [Streptomyces europaeiscabiei]MDX3702704.1 amidohydrolase family protein [Streptomyces europaeiscabiei]MDX3710555.1 amidohydrolase family protein [Streptomyces europaeiscabiei]